MADLNIGNSTANVIVNAKHNGAVNPQINNTYDLGTSTLRWKNIYGNLKGNASNADTLDGYHFSDLENRYVKKSGDIITGATQFNNYLKLNAWPGYGTGTANFWYDANNKFVEIQYATDLKLAGTKVSKEGHTHAVATTSANGFMSSGDKAKLDGITASADAVSFSRSLTSGIKVGTITINGTGTDLYAPTNTDTKNTTGSTDTSSKIFLVGATSQSENPQTYSDNQVYAQNGQLNGNSIRIAEKSTFVYNASTGCLEITV